MKVLLITHIFPPYIDGGSRVISKFGEYLKSQAGETLALTSDCRSTDDFASQRLRAGSLKLKKQKNIIRLPVYHSLRRPLKFFNLFVPADTYLSDLLKVFQKGPVFKILPFIKSLITIIKFKPDLIVAGPLPTTIVLYANFIKILLSTICRRRSKLLINASFHQTDPDFLKKPLIEVLKNADYIWSLTDYEKDFFKKELHIPEHKIITVGNGVDPNFLIDQSTIAYPKDPNLLFIGSFAAHKWIVDLIKAFSSLSAKYPKLTLTLAGQKTLYFPKIERFASSLDNSVKLKIKFIFNFPQENLQSLIDQSTILILPSSQESFGLVLIESMARGKPVITSDIPPLKELITKTDGGVCFNLQSNTYDLQSAINDLLSNKAKLKQHGLNGRAFVKTHYTWDKIGKTLCQNIS